MAMFLRPPAPGTDNWNISELALIGGIGMLLSAAWSLVIGSAYKGRGPPRIMIVVAVVVASVFIFMGLFYDISTKIVTFFMLMVPMVLSLEATASAWFDPRWKMKERSDDQLLFYLLLTVVICTACTGFALLTANTWVNS